MLVFKVHSGQDAGADVIGVYCGRHDDVEIYIRGRYAYVIFTSDLTISGTGFQATWEETMPRQRKNIRIYTHSYSSIVFT